MDLDGKGNATITNSIKMDWNNTLVVNKNWITKGDWTISSNDSNILGLGGRVIGETLAVELVRVWLETEYEGGRHQNRLDMFDKLGEKA